MEYSYCCNIVFDTITLIIAISHTVLTYRLLSTEHMASLLYPNVINIYRCYINRVGHV